MYVFFSGRNSPHAVSALIFAHACKGKGIRWYSVSEMISGKTKKVPGGTFFVQAVKG
jgi:hypothetical protein